MTLEAFESKVKEICERAGWSHLQWDTWFAVTVSSLYKQKFVVVKIRKTGATFQSKNEVYLEDAYLEVLQLLESQIPIQYQPSGDWIIGTDGKAYHRPPVSAKLAPIGNCFPSEEQATIAAAQLLPMYRALAWLAGHGGISSEAPFTIAYNTHYGKWMVVGASDITENKFIPRMSGAQATKLADALNRGEWAL